jgi:hypothetical protein
VRIDSVNLVNYSAEVQADLGGPPEGKLYSLFGTARTEDLSAGGCKLVTSEEIPAGVQLSFDLKLADHVVRCHGRVARSTEREGEWVAGIEFQDLDDMASDGIRLYLEFKSPPAAE